MVECWLSVCWALDSAPSTNKKNTKALFIPFNKTGLSVYYADNNSSNYIQCFSLLSGFLCCLFPAIIKQVLLCPPCHVLGDEVQGSQRLVPKVT